VKHQYRKTSENLKYASLLSQGSVATYLGYGGLFSNHFTTDLLLSLLVKQFFKIYVNIWQSYRQDGCVVQWYNVGRCCFFLLLSVQSQLDIIAEHRRRRRCGLLFTCRVEYPLDVGNVEIVDGIGACQSRPTGPERPHDRREGSTAPHNRPNRLTTVTVRSTD